MGDSAELTIDDVVEAWPGWRIGIQVSATDHPAWSARPIHEEARPPVFTHEQLARGLRGVVYAALPGQLSERIDAQDRLRREMHDSGERALDGETYLDVQDRQEALRRFARDTHREYKEIDALLSEIADEERDG